MMNKRVKAWLLCVLMLCSVLMLCACKGDEEKSGEPTTAPSQPSTEATNPSTEATEPSTEPAAPGNAFYKVTLIDGLGNPCGDKMLVTFMKDGQKVSMVKVDAHGVALKELPAGDYTVVVSSTNSELKFYYEAESATLTAEKTETEIVLVSEQGEVFQGINAYAPGGDEMLPYDAYAVGAGCTHVYLTAGDRSYFLFAPTEAGTYELSVNGDAATLGIYGASVHFIQSSSTLDVVDNKITLSINSGMIGTGETGTTVYVIGLDSVNGAEDAVLNIIRTGDAAWTIEQEPWIPYNPKMPVSPFTLEPGITLKEFDLTASTDAYNLVKDADGYYHLNSVDGPRVYVQLEEALYGISMLAMVGEIVFQDGELIPTGTAPFRYMYNNGKDDFFKEDYTDAMRKYVTNRCEYTGVYPLTEDLAYILPMGMKNIGWLREETSNFLFRDLEGFNEELGWLFLCVYEDVQAPPQPTEPSEPTQPTEPSKPTEPSEPSKPTEPSEPSSEPSKPVTKPTEPTEPAPQPPIEVSDILELDVEVQASHIVYYNLYKMSDATLIIRDPNAYVIYNKKTYEAVDGIVTVPDLYTRYTDQPIQIAIGNNGTKDVSFHVEFTYPEGHIKNPIEVGGVLEFDAAVQANHIVYYDLYKLNEATLIINNPNAYVIYNNKTYKAVNGVVTVPDLYVRYTNQPIKIAIGNEGTKNASFHVEFTYPEGHTNNPINVTMGSFTANVKANNEVGVNYQWIATADGTFTLTLDGITDGVNAAILVTRVETIGEGEDAMPIPHTITLDDTGSNTVSIQVKAGELVKINIGTQPKKNKYPAATIEVTASFA